MLSVPKGEMTKPDAIYYGKYCYHGEYFMGYEELICDANNLYRAYLASIKGSKWKETTQRFMMNFLRHIFSIQEDLVNRTLQNGPTQEFTLSERGRVRPITSIQIRDRIVRHVLCDEVLLQEVRKHVIYDNCASLKGRGISQNFMTTSFTR